VADPISDKIDPAVRPAPSPLEQAEVPRANLQLDAFVDTVRSFLRDYPELNRLIAGVESSNRQIVWAIIDCLDEYNTTPPFTQFGLSDFPSRSLLLRGTVCTLLESIGLLQTRNHLQFSDGGLTVGINDKTQFIQSWLSIFRSAYEDKKIKLKVAYNIETAWGGGIHSEFRFINNFYGEW
jgi:hypothetical protein